MVGGLRDVITCAEFQIEIFMGYDFTGGRIFDFPIDFSMGLTTVPTALPVIIAVCLNNHCFHWQLILDLEVARWHSGSAA